RRIGLSRISLPKTALAMFFVAAVVWCTAYLWVRQWDPARDHVEAGRNFVRLGMGTEAEREWKEAVRVNPNSAAAWELLAAYYISVQNWAAAVEPLRHLARLQPDAPHVFVRLASCAYKAGDPWSALREAESELRRDPNNVGALTIAAKVLATLD